MLKKKNMMIAVTFQKEGIHCYPQALTDPKLATGNADDVSFLGYPHRHIFYFKVKIQVFEEDRDLEFIQVKRQLENWYNTNTLQLDYKSCEMISDDLALKIQDTWPGRNVEIHVYEDNENGSESFYEWVE
jgi:hypothetical protein